MSVLVPTTQERRSHVVRLPPPIEPARPRELSDEEAWFTATNEELAGSRPLIEGLAEGRYQLVLS